LLSRPLGEILAALAQQATEGGGCELVMDEELAVDLEEGEVDATGVGVGVTDADADVCYEVAGACAREQPDAGVLAAFRATSHANGSSNGGSSAGVVWSGKGRLDPSRPAFLEDDFSNERAAAWQQQGVRDRALTHQAAQAQRAEHGPFRTLDVLQRIADSDVALDVHQLGGVQFSRLKATWSSPHKRTYGMRVNR
jgi:hypothetical protein